MNSGNKLKAGKNNQQMDFVTCFLDGASQEIKPKSNESMNSGTKLKAPKLEPQERFHHSLLEKLKNCEGKKPLKK